MQVPRQFERLSAWLRGQHSCVDRVSSEQSTATHLVSTAEYELGRLRRELTGIALESGVGLSNLPDVDILATKAVAREPLGGGDDRVREEQSGLGESPRAARATKRCEEGSSAKRAKVYARANGDQTSDAA